MTKISVDDKPLSLQELPIIRKGRILVPMRSLFEALGATVKWDNSTQRVSAIKGDNKIELKIGDTKVKNNRNTNTISLDVPPVIIKGRTFVPLRFVSESSGYKVSWDGEQVLIDTKGRDKSKVQTTNSFKNQNSYTACSTYPSIVMGSISLEKLVYPLLGIPYRYGGGSVKGFDCSGFTSYVMQYLGIKLPRTSSEQFNTGTTVDREHLSTGDLLFFSTTKDGKVDHVGICLGENKMVLATLKEVEISDITWYINHYEFMGAKRVLK